MGGDAQVHYRPARGETAWWVAVEGAALAVLAPEATERTADAVWRRVGEGGIGAVLDALTGAFGTSLAAIPPFALAVGEPTGLRVAVRGPIEVIVDTASGPQAVTGEGVATWAERFLPGATRVTVASTGGAAEDAAVPVRSGVVVADLVVATLSGVAPASHPTTSEIAASSDPNPVDGSDDAQISEDADAAGAGGAAESSADTWMPAETEGTASAPADEYDLLWGETVARPIAAAASAPTPADDEGADAGGAEVKTDAGPPAPAAASASAAPAPAADPPGPLGDHDGATVSVAEARALRAAEREQYESTDNVPGRRPARGRIVLSSGRVVELERPVVIGRRPKSTRTSGSELPTLVAVDSPEQDISRSHVEIRAEGEHVLVTDLHTTNGTVLLRGGADPVRLHPGEPTMVVDGDVLDLGDSVTVTFEDLA